MGAEQVGHGDQLGSARSEDTVSSSLSGTAGSVVQARDVNGGVHFHPAGLTAALPPRQLPPDLHGFVGRVDELERMEALLADSAPGRRLVVILGTAGAGKTSLAVRLAHRVRAAFPDGLWVPRMSSVQVGEGLVCRLALARFGGFRRVVGVVRR